MTRNNGRRSLRNRRVQALIAGLALVLLVFGLSGVRSTMAAWTDSKESTGSFEAATVPAPVLTKNCEYVPGVLGIGARVRIYWQIPAGYQLDDVAVEASTKGLGSVLAPITGFYLSPNTTSNGGGKYTTNVPTGLLGGLLGLGDQLEIAFFVEHEGGWRSKPASVVSYAQLLGSGTCSNLT